MEFKGTPGPWKYTVRNANEIITTFHGVVIGDIYLDITIDSQKEGARLIAAAPDLLYSLQKLLAEYKFTRSQLNGDTEEDLVDVLCVRNAMAAINKALGRE
ncbi:hypothetical protein [Morganella morganii]|uniref:hypothetical protein n=1 Tax=Morganella morganii TaxID=582 RepID=UPI001BD9C125|nr:hypothetical protein [Morganella morganii]MBT0306022.1 hypothetical protein [Morganella morganii subsp. morganii]